MELPTLELYSNFKLFRNILEYKKLITFPFRFQNFAVEIQAGNDTELDIELFRDALNRAGGANYGTGVRDL